MRGRFNLGRGRGEATRTAGQMFDVVFHCMHRGLQAVEHVVHGMTDTRCRRAAVNRQAPAQIAAALRHFFKRGGQRVEAAILAVQLQPRRQRRQQCASGSNRRQRSGIGDHACHQQYRRHAGETRRCHRVPGPVTAF